MCRAGFVARAALLVLDAILLVDCRTDLRRPQDQRTVPGIVRNSVCSRAVRRGRATVARLRSADYG
jgi:hypothetical protein